MAKNLSHHDWVLQQFDKYLRRAYRDVLIHSSIIEGVLRNESGKGKFDEANKHLLNTKKINSSEFCVFNKVREIRNSLVHDSFRSQLVQNDIDKLRDALMENILDAYKKSTFLNEKLFKKYSISRSASIKFNPVK